MNDNNFQNPPENKGSGCAVKIVVALAIGGVLCIALCCGIGWYFSTQAMKVTEKPAEVNQMRGEIVDIDLPDGLPPAAGIQMNMGVFKMQVVVFGKNASPQGAEPTGEGKMLMLMQMEVSGMSKQDMEQQLRQQARQQQNEDVHITKSETRKLMIDGKEQEFDFAEGTIDTDNGEVQVRQVSGSFPSRQGYALLLYIVPEDEWDEEETVKMIESIRK